MTQLSPFRHANYVYLGGPGLTRAQLKEILPGLVIVLSPASEPLRMQPVYGDEPWIAVGLAAPAEYGRIYPARQQVEQYGEGIKRLGELKAAAAGGSR